MVRSMGAKICIGFSGSKPVLHVPPTRTPFESSTFFLVPYVYHSYHNSIDAEQRGASNRCFALKEHIPFKRQR